MYKSESAEAFLTPEDDEAEVRRSRGVCMNFMVTDETKMDGGSKRWVLPLRVILSVFCLSLKLTEKRSHSWKPFKLQPCLKNRNHGGRRTSCRFDFILQMDRVTNPLLWPAGRALTFDPSWMSSLVGLSFPLLLLCCCFDDKQKRPNPAPRIMGNLYHLHTSRLYLLSIDLLWKDLHRVSEDLCNGRPEQLLTSADEYILQSHVACNLQVKYQKNRAGIEEIMLQPQS